MKNKYSNIYFALPALRFSAKEDLTAEIYIEIEIYSCLNVAIRNIVYSILIMPFSIAVSWLMKILENYLLLINLLALVS